MSFDWDRVREVRRRAREFDGRTGVMDKHNDVISLVCGKDLD